MLKFIHHRDRRNNSYLELHVNWIRLETKRQLENSAMMSSGLKGCGYADMGVCGILTSFEFMQMAAKALFLSFAFEILTAAAYSLSHSHSQTWHDTNNKRLVPRAPIRGGKGKASAFLL